MKKPNLLTPRELATVLAALRYWQREGLSSAGHERDIATDGESFEALNAGEIDALCERLNFGVPALDAPCVHCGLCHAPEEGTPGYFCEPD